MRVGAIRKRSDGRPDMAHTSCSTLISTDAAPGIYVPSGSAHPANSFQEKAALCRAAENTCYFATVNYASAGSPTTSGVVRPDGTLLTYQPYGTPGLLIADIDIAAATGLLAARYKSV